MSRYQEVFDNILIGDREGPELYNRVFVVSAYGGITDMLLEHKRTDKPGVFSLYAESDTEWAWGDALNEVCTRMCEINAEMFTDHFERQHADQFVKERVEGVRSCLIDLQRICSYGHFQVSDQLTYVREMLSAIGEAHSAHNTAQLLQLKGVNATFVDLTGWRETDNPSFDDRIKTAFDRLDLTSELPIVTGYARCAEGVMETFDRGYSEMTFSRIATLTDAREAIIHKEYHLSSADPRVVGVDNVIPIGRTNYDVADQLSNLGMEAVHPKAAKGLRQCDIPLRVKNTFEPEHAGTLIETDYKSDEPGVEIIAGRRNVFAIEFYEQDMVGATNYDRQLLEVLERFKAKVVSKDINANTITHYVAGSLKQVKRICKAIGEAYPSSSITTHRISIVSAVGSDLKVPGLMKEAVTALTEAGINILSVHQTMRQVEMEFVLEDADYENAIKCLHRHLVEPHAQGEALNEVKLDHIA